MSVQLFWGIIFVLYGIRTGGLGSQNSLSVDFYEASCPTVDSIVFDTMTKLAKESNVVPPSTLRMFFHDCFIEGCDASIMISSTSSMKAERELPENNIAQNAFEAIVEVKKAVDRVCPGVVSCADIIAMAARDAVRLLGGPNWDVLKGRLDGFVSSAARAKGKVPLAEADATQLIQAFAARKLSVLDMVVLSGAHTVGFSHCNQFTNRLYNFSPGLKSDPSLNSTFALELEQTCPKGGDPNRFQPFDITTPFVFDNKYFKNLQSGKGLLFSDQDLVNSNLSVDIVRNLASSQEVFFSQFVDSMVKLGNVGVKTKLSVGNIRSDCTAFNS
ncbi:hypothetical protein SUGI_0501500 [Cryptomeria japonica]|uniref:peroxidase 50 n=1 Tax=Cryptomeria japonica TaxID=3369 RepID=UPI002408CA76|nr:peroxidase 50 [Cryptomeria japonica]GLJ26155.1 hypothetical protein SUGI_0501500 [Cryptomeria japonica]